MEGLAKVRSNKFRLYSRSTKILEQPERTRVILNVRKIIQTVVWRKTLEANKTTIILQPNKCKSEDEGNRSLIPELRLTTGLFA